MKYRECLNCADGIFELAAVRLNLEALGRPVILRDRLFKLSKCRRVGLRKEAPNFPAYAGRRNLLLSISQHRMAIMNEQIAEILGLGFPGPEKPST